MTYSSILFNGCSLCWGDELNSPYEQRYSRKVAEHFGAVDHNISKRGISSMFCVKNQKKGLKLLNGELYLVLVVARM